MKSIIGILLIFTFIATSAQDLKIKEPVRFLALGDSYTIGESVPESGRWPVQLMDSLEARGYKTGTLKIIATVSNCQKIKGPSFFRLLGILYRIQNWA